MDANLVSTLAEDRSRRAKLTFSSFSIPLLMSVAVMWAEGDEASSANTVLPVPEATSSTLALALSGHESNPYESSAHRVKHAAVCTA